MNWQLVGNIAGVNGRDAEVDLVAKRATELIPREKEGIDRDALRAEIDAAVSKAMASMSQLVSAEVAKAIALIPVPKDGRDGTSVDAQAVEAWIAGRIEKAIIALPKPRDGQDGRDGRDVDAAQLEVVVAANVERAVSALPAPKDGRSVTIEDVSPLVGAEVAKAMSAIALPKDGVGLMGAVVDRAGHLVITLSDGTTKDVGLVVGKDVDASVIHTMIVEEVSRLPPPKDGLNGKDGFGFDDFVVVDGERSFELRFTRGTEVKTFTVTKSGFYDRGLWIPGEYLKGEGVTWNNCFWIAQRTTTDKPGDGATGWRMAVREGKRGKEGPEGKPGRDGRDLTSMDTKGTKW